MGFLDRMLGRVGAPVGATGELEPGEDILAVAQVHTGHLVATRVGLWVPGDDRPTRIPWHLISRATWDSSALELTVAQVTGTAGAAVLLTDVERRSYEIAEPGELPAVVNARVTATVRSAHHRRFAGGGAWFVQRRVPGRDGVVLQARIDPGTDAAVVADIAAAVAAKLPR